MRESIKALINGAEPLCRPGEIDDHLSSCQPCRDWEARAIAMRNRSQQRASQRGVLASPRAAKHRLGAQLRYALGIVAVTEVAPGILWLVEAVGGPTLDDAREVVATEIAFAISCLVAALQPRRALGALQVALGLSVLIAGTSIADVARGIATPLSESHHVVELAGISMLALLARQVARASMVMTDPGQSP